MHLSHGDEVAACMTSEARHAIARDVDLLAELAACGDVDHNLFVGKYAINGASRANHGLKRIYLDLAIEVIALAVKAFVLSYLNAYDKVSRARTS
jgi:hypothetical protein